MSRPTATFLLSNKVDVALCAAATELAATGWLPYFADASFLTRITIAVLAAVSAASVAAARRWSPEWTAAVGIIGAGLVLCYVVFGQTTNTGAPTAQTLSAFGHAFTRGWVRMLTVGLPADATPDLVAIPVLLSFAAAFVSTLVALRTRLVLTPAAPVGVSYVVAILYCAGRGDHVGREQIALSSLLVLVTAVHVAYRAGKINAAIALQLRPDEVGGRARGGRGAVVLAGPAVAFVAALGALVSATVPLDASRRFDLREYTTPTLRPSTLLSPLAGVRSQLVSQPVTNVLSLRLSTASPALDRIRTGVLDRYDGATWDSDGSYRVYGRTLTRDPGIGSGSIDVTAHVAIQSLAGPFVPELGHPTKIRWTSRRGEIGYDSTSGALISSASNLAGFTYDLSTQVRLRSSALNGVSTGPPLPNIAVAPPDLTAAAQTLTKGQPDVYRKLVTLEAFVASRPYNIRARPGESFATVRRILGLVASQSSVGYAEQHAVAFAVLANALNLPTRIAVGYLLRKPIGGVYQVRSSDAHAWPEVYFRGFGWEAFEPTDPSRLGGDVSTSRTTVADGPNAPIVPPTAPSPVAVPQASAHGAAGNGFVTAVVTAAIGVGVVASAAVLFAGSVLLTRAVTRRRRRRERSPQARVLGAWLEVLDLALERGLRPSRSLTPNEVAEFLISAGQQPNERTTSRAPDSLRTLATMTTSAFFGGEVSDEQADQAWRIEREVARALYPSRLSRISQVRGRLSPRPVIHGWQTSAARRRLVITAGAGS